MDGGCKEREKWGEVVVEESRSYSGGGGGDDGDWRLIETL